MRQLRGASWTEQGRHCLVSMLVTVLRGPQPRTHPPTSSSSTWIDSTSVQKGWDAGPLSFVTLHSEPLGPPNYSPIHSAPASLRGGGESTAALCSLLSRHQPLPGLIASCIRQRVNAKQLVNLVKANKSSMLLAFIENRGQAI